MAGCRSCQKGGNAGETMGGSPQLTGGDAGDMPVPEGMGGGSLAGAAGDMPPEGMENGGSLAGAAGGDPTAAPPIMQGGGKNNHMVGGGCGKCGSSKKHKGGMLQEAAVPVLLTLAATRKGKSLKNRLTLGMLNGGKKSRKAKGKGKGKKTKGKKQQKKGKKTRKYHKRR